MMKEFFQGVSEAFGMSQPYDPPKFPKEQQLNPPPEIVELARMEIELKRERLRVRELELQVELERLKRSGPSPFDKLDVNDWKVTCKDEPSDKPR